MFAVIKSGGRQFKVSVGQKLEVEQLPFEPGKQIEIGEVLLISDADTSLIGTPFLEKAKVLATVGEPTRGKKLIVFRYKPKKRFRHKRGHRQNLTVLTIDDIINDGKSLVTGEEPRARTTTDEASTEAPATESTTAENTATETKPASTEKRSRRRRSTSEETTESGTEE